MRRYNKSQAQMKKEELNPMYQSQYNTDSLEGKTETYKPKKEKNSDSTFLDYLTFKNIPKEYDIQYDESSVEDLIMPDFLKSSGNGFIERNKETDAIIESLFKADKFRQQAYNMQLYFEEGLTLAEIEVVTRVEGLFNELAPIEAMKRIKKRIANISRSINLGLDKIRKHLSDEQWYKIKYNYGYK